MRVLLDTHAFLWAAGEPERLGRQRELVADPATTLLLSAASSWEIAIKHALGTLVLPASPTQYVPRAMARLDVTGLGIDHDHALHVGRLPDHHRDPFDRLLVAQCQLARLPVVTADPAIAAYDLDVLAP